MSLKPFSIITAVYNDNYGLRTTASSIESCSEYIKEWIICDGTPFDIPSYTPSLKSVNVIYRRCSDNGIYDAWNSALPLVSSEWCLFLGAGDVFYNHSAVMSVANCLNHLDNTILFVSSKVTYPTTMKHKNPIVVSRNKPTLLFRGCPPHSALLTRVQLFKIGHKFDDQLEIISDAEFMIRFPEESFWYTDTILTLMDRSGKSHQSIFWHKKVSEALYIIRKHQIIPGFRACLFFLLACCKNYPIFLFTILRY